MRAVFKHVLDRLRLAQHCQEGIAAVEFALVLPIMLLLYIGSVEVSALISMDRRVQSVAGALGDLVARHDTKISATRLSDYFKAAGGIMTPFETTDLRQAVTQVEVRANGTTRVLWSQKYVNGILSTNTAHPVNSSYALPQAMIDIALGKFVIVAEGSYSYEPLYGYAFNQTINLYRENYFMPRFGGSIALQ